MEVYSSSVDCAKINSVESLQLFLCCELHVFVQALGQIRICDFREVLRYHLSVGRIKEPRVCANF